VLAIEVARSAITALLTGHEPDLQWPLAALFAGKLIAKGGIALFGLSLIRRGAGPGIKALTTDARNDVLVNSLALVGFFGARSGWPALDAWLALPTALWIGFAGAKLARDNIKLLMGEAPGAGRQLELLEVARKIAGVKGAHDLRAQYIGTKLQVHVHVVVEKELTVKQGHDIGERVRERLEQEPDVSHVSVHIDIA
jgi:cation diffusion facilitator family transporter